MRSKQESGVQRTHPLRHRTVWFTVIPRWLSHSRRQDVPLRETHQFCPNRKNSNFANSKGNVTKLCETVTWDLCSHFSTLPCFLYVAKTWFKTCNILPLQVAVNGRDSICLAHYALTVQLLRAMSSMRYTQKIWMIGGDWKLFCGSKFRRRPTEGWRQKSS